MTILVTGGAGYIGSHACVELAREGRGVVVLDDFSNAEPAAIDRIASVTGERPTLVEGDIRDTEAVARTLRDHQCNGVMHFAGLKAVGESVADPLRYYDVNVGGSRSLLAAMAACGVRRIIFSSSATVYGEPEQLPLDETHRLVPVNPYGRTKLTVEDMLRDLHASDPRWDIAILRYFNPVGAHESGRMGEAPTGVPNNLMPYVAQVATGERSHLSVFGDDYDTPDGTGVRDYIHVVDLAAGHLAALRALEAQAAGGLLTYNLGTGRGHSVLDLVRAYEEASGQAIALQRAPRREGDVAISYADPAYAEAGLNWRATRDLDAMCRDSWRWVRPRRND